MTRPVVADGQPLAPPRALSGTSISTTETTQASSANATDFFNGLLMLPPTPEAPQLTD
ncbi:hypothetical protein QO004_006284 [Rhizobium mesoamericanum]|nr:hypothetical protein [Rhizobium mesoamericanum]